MAVREPVASVVVAVRGNASAVQGLVRAIEDQDFRGGMELVVVDNHPVPAVDVAQFGAVGVPCRVVHERAAGLSRARNTGIRHARGEYVLITDPDARPERSWVRNMVRALQETGAYCAGGKVVARFTGQARDLPAEVMDLFVPPSWPKHTVGLEAPFWVVGCNLAMRRDPLPQFDTRFGVMPRRHLSCEELEFTVRAQQEGRAVVVVPDAVVHRAIHPSDLTARSVWARALWHGVSIARLVGVHPEADIYDSYRLRDALAFPRLRSRPGRAAAAADLARIVGLRSEQARLLLWRWPSKTQQA